MRGERSEITNVDRGDDCATSEIGDGHEECVDGVFRTTSGRTEQSAGAHTSSGVHGMNENALSSKLAEDGCVRGSAADEFGEHGRDGRNRKLPPTHLVNESSDPIATSSRAVCN